MTDEATTVDRVGGPEDRLREENARLRRAVEEQRVLIERLSRLAPVIASELDPERLVQRLTDEATSIVGAAFGALFTTVIRPGGERAMLYTLSGAPREAFEKLGMPRATQVFGPTFAGEGVVRSDDITKDPRYGHNAPFRGMPDGHLPVVSYLAVPVRSMQGETLGGLFFGHPKPGVFRDLEERAAVAVSAMAGAALENAQLFRKLADREAALDAAYTRHRLVNEATREGIWYWDLATGAVEWSDALLGAMGMDRATWGGSFDDWFSRVHPDDRPKLERALRDHLERREPYVIDMFRVRHESGDYRWFTTVGQAEWDEDGTPRRMAGSVRDVTERKLAEDALRASELRYAQILDSVHDMIFCKNPRLTVVYANAATCRYYKMSPDELRGVTDVPYNEIDFTKQYNADDRTVFETGRPVERHEEPNVAPSGETRYFHTVKSPIFDETGRVVEIVGVSRDITERKRAVEAQRKLAEASAILARSIDYEETLSNVARALVPAVAEWSAVDVVEDGEIRRIAVAHPDEEKVELAYELARRYPTPMDAPHGVPAVVRTGRTEVVTDVPDELLAAAARDPEHLAILRELGLRSYIVVPMKAHDRVLGAITLVTVGQRRFDEKDVAFAEELAARAATALENALLYRAVRELNATLERRVEERTTALVEANKELESFSYTVSHDLRAPVRHIGGFLDLLTKHAGDKLDAKSRRYIATIRTAATHMGTLIDGLLAFSRLGRVELATRTVALDEIVRAIVRELHPDTKGRDITFEIGELPAVEADPTMIRVVMTNLLGNAIKYTRQKPAAHIEIGSERREHDHVVWVRDDGTGFNMDYVHKLFGVFQRLHSEDDFEGTGIGLATARRIVHRHGGRIWAEGVEGQGATFYFTVPHREGSS